MTSHGGEGDTHIGQVVHVMYEGALGNPGAPARGQSREPGIGDESWRT